MSWNFFHDLLAGESGSPSDSDSSGGSHHPSDECFMVGKGRVMGGAITNIPKYSREMNSGLWLEDYWLACQAGGADSDDFIIHNLPLFLADSA